MDENTKNSPPKKYKASKAVVNALANAELLLVHTTEYGLEIKKEQIQVLTQAKEAYDNDEWTKEVEVEFWLVFKELTKLIYPVSIDSLASAQETEIKNPNRLQKLLRIKTRQTVAHSSVRFYTALSIITMIVMLVIHIYFSIGTIRLNRIQQCNERLSKIDTRYNELMLLTDTESGNKSAELEKIQLEAEMFEIDDEKNSNIRLLEEWLIISKKILLIYDEPEPEEQISADNIEEDFMPMPPTDEMNSTIEIIQEAQNYVLVLGLYILPLFFGLLGAIAFVLRDLVLQTKKMIFSKETNINYTLRLILGTLAGLAVGLLWSDIKQQQNLMMLESFSPLIIAFLSGLSVEYVFSGIEQIVSNFIKKGVNGKNDKQGSKK